MSTLRAIASTLLALLLVVFGSNYFLHMFPLPPGDQSAGDQLLQAMRDGGLMAPIAFSHMVCGVLLLIPRTRFLGSLLQLPMTIGMVAFHATMLPAGLVMAGPMLVLNLAVAVDPPRLRAVLGRESRDDRGGR